MKENGTKFNVIWHQTRKEAFYEILKSKKLCVSYSQEEIMPQLRLAFPMICLCDLPLSEFASNNWTYGEYAIGFKRDWAIRNGFNPVCYYHHQSNLMQQIEYDIIGSNHNIPVVKSQYEMDLEGAQRLIQEVLRFGQERWKKQEDHDAFKHDE